MFILSPVNTFCKGKKNRRQKDAPPAAEIKDDPYKDVVHIFECHDNCPQKTAALSARIQFLFYESSYTDHFTVSMTGSARADNIASFEDYVLCCRSIADAIDCNLLLNTREDGSGMELFFSTRDELVSSINRMMEAGETAVYAFYPMKRLPQD